MGADTNKPPKLCNAYIEKNQEIIPCARERGHLLLVDPAAFSMLGPAGMWTLSHRNYTEAGNEVFWIDSTTGAGYVAPPSRAPETETWLRAAEIAVNSLRAYYPGDVGDDSIGWIIAAADRMTSHVTGGPS